jgi:prophage antirepressor-like protein
LSRLSSDEKDVSQINTLGGKQKMTIINESGLYSLLFYMQPQKAKGVSQNNALIEERISQLKKFRRWVTSEVLPSIRKHGGYLTKEKLEEMLLDPDVVLELATKLKEARLIK